jgi:hypothetical protein
MHYTRLFFFLSQVILVIAGTAAAQPVAATIDATRTGPPIARLIFGGFMEPATTGVWAERFRRSSSHTGRKLTVSGSRQSHAAARQHQRL